MERRDKEASAVPFAQEHTMSDIEMSETDHTESDTDAEIVYGCSDTPWQRFMGKHS